jgi:hypothetical protein
MAKRYGHIGQAALMNAVAALDGGTAGASPADGKKKPVKSERPTSRKKQSPGLRKTTQHFS